MSMLTEKEKKEIEELKPNFNRIVENNDNYHYVSSRRVEISRIWAKKLLVMSFVLNLISIACFGIAFVTTWNKPYPSYYASTPSGKVYGPLPQFTK